MKVHANASYPSAKPPWIRVKLPNTDQVRFIRDLKSRQHLHTVCESALCPNIGECWANDHATFLLLGEGCTRQCAFCGVSKNLQPVDETEPERVAEAVAAMGLKHAVITSVTRDDLSDGGAGHFAAAIRHIRKLCMDTTIELLIPDFVGSRDSLETVLAAQPDILGHNMETVFRLYPKVRPGAGFNRSLSLLETVKAVRPDMIIKSGIMVGLGETTDEILETITSLKSAGVDILTIGQYLRPGPSQLPVERYYHPDEFAKLKESAMNLGFSWVESGPLVRSSYGSKQQASALCGRKSR
ncbi:MAG: lipoyl synthase [Desulfosalsimonadaceae bacterium]|nr:lipoyl synthase [Desulfosalsimonadaceae bacterium]